MRDFAELFREAASRGYVVLLPPPTMVPPPGQQLARGLATPSTPDDAEAATLLRLRLDLALTAAEARVLRTLAQHGYASKQALHTVVSGDAPTTTIATVEVLVCKLRAKLKPRDIEIVTVSKAGYKLTETGREKIHGLLGSGEQAITATPPVGKPTKRPAPRDTHV